MHFTEPVYRNPYWPTWPLLEVTRGCTHNKCEFCTMYKGVKFGVAPMEQIEEDLRELAADMPHARTIQLLSANPLAREPEDITLLDVFRAIEDDQPLFRFHENPSAECPVGSNIYAVLGARLDETASAMEAQLASVTLAELAADTRDRIAASAEAAARREEE